MSGDEVCRLGSRKKSNENCEHPDPVDGGAVQCVGPWADEKHYYLSTYFSATRAVRARFAHGGAAFVDLFAGPGRIHVRDRATTTLGSSLLGVTHDAAPFSKIILCDKDEENAEALRARTAGDKRVLVVEGDCNAEIERIAAEIPNEGLNLALIDPFGVRALRWATLATLGRFKRMDLLIHFPTSTVKRNLLNKSNANFGDEIDQMVGNDRWRSGVKKFKDVVRLIDVLREQLATLGYQPDSVRSLEIKANGKVLYHLMFASKDPLGSKIWESIAKNGPLQWGLFR